MNTVVRLFIAATLFCVCTLGEKRYERFQPLGFGIYTGNAYAFQGFNETCHANIFPPDCPSEIEVSTLIKGGIYNPEKDFVCLECAGLNPECECNKTTLTCRGSTGFERQDLQCYLGLNDSEKDVMGRLSIMEAAVERAYEHSDKDGKTLKIFNAPEFYWRGENGAYPASSIFGTDDGFNPLHEIGKELERIVEQKRFEDWLFVFGTVIAVEQVNASQFAYYNFAPTYKGFDNSTESSTGRRFLFPKRYISGADFLEESRFSTHVPNPSNEFYDNDGWNQVREWFQERDYTIVDHNWFVLDDIAMTLEICLDHGSTQAQINFGLLSASNDVLIPSGVDGTLDYVQVPQNRAQISLVTSAGMLVNNPVLTSGGSIFLQDGHTPTLPQLQTCSVTLQEDSSLFQRCAQDNVTSFHVYDSEEEAHAAMMGLYSVSIGILPRINVFGPYPIAAQEAGSGSTCPPTPTSHAPPGLQTGLCRVASLGSAILLAGWLFVLESS